MPAIQNIGRQVGAPGPVDYAQARPSQAFAQTGKAAAGLGNALDQLAEQDAAVAGLKALSDFDAASGARMEEMQRTAKTPDGFSDAWAKDWTQRADALIGATPNERTARFLQERIAAGKGRAVMQGMAWEAQQKEAVQATQFGQSVNEIANGIMRDPSRFPEALANLDAMLSAGQFEPAKREALWGPSAAQYAQSYLNGLPPDEALRRLNAGEVDKYINADSKIGLTSHFEAKIRQAEVEGRVAENSLQTLADRQMQARINAYANGQAARPVFTPADREAVGEVNAIENDMRLSDADAKIQTQQTGLMAVTAALALGQKLNPNDAKARAGVEAHFTQTFVPLLDQVAPEQRVDAIVAQIGKYGMVPDSFSAAMIETPLASGTPEQKAQAAQIYARLAQEQPNYVAYVPDKMRRTATLINSYRDAGYTAERAAQAADADLKLEAKSGRDIAAEYREAVKPDSPGKPSKSKVFLQSAFDEGWFSAEPAAQAAAVAAFDTLTSHEYAANGGNLELAQKTALDKFRAQYGVSRVNGAPVLMRQAPELHYSIPGLPPAANSAWIKGQAVEDLNVNSAAPIASQDVRIVPYVQATGREVTSPDGRPAYSLSVIGPDGQVQVQMDYTLGSPNYGQPLAWYPDTEKATAEYNSASELRQHFTLDVARFERDAPKLGRQQRHDRRAEIVNKYGLHKRYIDTGDSLMLHAPFIRKPKADGKGGTLFEGASREQVASEMRARGVPEWVIADDSSHWAFKAGKLDQWMGDTAPKVGGEPSAQNITPPSEPARLPAHPVSREAFLEMNAEQQQHIIDAINTPTNLDLTDIEASRKANVAMSKDQQREFNSIWAKVDAAGAKLEGLAANSEGAPRSVSDMLEAFSQLRDLLNQLGRRTGAKPDGKRPTTGGGAYKLQ